MTVYRDLQGAQQAYQSQRENLAREALSYHTVESTGVGETIDPDPFVFDNPFVFKPAVSYGVEVVSLPDLALWTLPRPTGAVMRWERNERGFYTKAYVYVVVEIDIAQGAAPENQPTMKLEHHFVFSGLAYKSLGEKALAQVEDPNIPPLPVNL